MRAEPYPLQPLRIRFSVDPHQVRLDVAMVAYWESVNQKVGHAHVQPWLVEAHSIGHGKTHCSQHGGSPSFTATAGFSTIHDKAGSMVPDMLVVEDSILVHLGIPKQAKA